MKLKKSLKLSLNKKTIARLNGEHQDAVKGGEETMSCNTGCFLPDTMCICITGYTMCVANC